MDKPRFKDLPQGTKVQLHDDHICRDLLSGYRCVSPDEEGDGWHAEQNLVGFIYYHPEFRDEEFLWVPADVEYRYQWTPEDTNNE